MSITDAAPVAAGSPEALGAAALADIRGGQIGVTPWTGRPARRAMTSEKLAGWVEREIERSDSLLFTLTPREELDEIGRWQQLADQAWVGQMRAIVAAHNRAGLERREFACDEVALAINASPTAGSNLSQTALSLAELPGLLESVSAGTLTQRHALAVLRELDMVESLGVELRASIVLIALARYDGQTPGELRKIVARLILLVDPEAALHRQNKATKDRRVSLWNDVDGQGIVHGRGPLAQIAAIKASLKQWLRDNPKAPDDPRTESEREWDLFASLLTGGVEAGSWQMGVVVPFSTAQGGDLELADIEGFGPILPSTARELIDIAETLTQIAVDERGDVIAVSDPIAVPDRTHTAKDDEDEGDGGTGGGDQPPTPSGPSSGSAFERPTPTHGVDVEDEWAQAMRLLMAQPPLERLLPDTLSSTAYKTPTRLRRFLEARDRTCVFPGCHRRITDIDHRIPWPLGPTTHWNCQLLCRHHHRAKQAAFTVELTTDGDYLWTTRGGWQFERKRQGY
jgi:hypothetical protein